MNRTESTEPFDQKAIVLYYIIFITIKMQISTVDVTVEPCSIFHVLCINVHLMWLSRYGSSNMLDLKTT